MESNPLLPLPQGMQIDQIQASQNEVSIPCRLSGHAPRYPAVKKAA